MSSQCKALKADGKPTNDARQEIVFLSSLQSSLNICLLVNLPCHLTTPASLTPPPAARLLLVYMALTNELVSTTAPLLAMTSAGGSHPCFTRTLTFQEMLMRDFFFLLAGSLMTTQMIASSFIRTEKIKRWGKGTEREEDLQFRRSR